MVCGWPETCETSHVNNWVSIPIRCEKDRNVVNYSLACRYYASLFTLASTFCANKKCYVNNYGEFQMDTSTKSSVNYMSTSMLPAVSINQLHKHAIPNNLFHIISSISVITITINWSKLSSLLRPRPMYTRRTKSIPWLLMTWLLLSPGHQQPQYWMRKIGRSLPSRKKDVN